MKSKDVDLSIRQYFENRGWRWESVSNLPASLVLDSVITPFFSTRTVGRGKGVYMVQGYLGVLHREFEKNWMSAKRGVNDLALDNKYCIILNTQNIDDLYKLSYLEYFEDDLDGFCKEVSNLLDKILEDIACLREVFAQNELAGIELEKFVGYGQRDKFEEFKLFVTGMN